MSTHATCTRRRRSQTTGVAVACWTAMFYFATAPVLAADRPNILWITAEDLCPDLGCYGDAYATSPEIDRFASSSVRYSNAYATAPVCSPARSCLITGIYATTLGTQRLRSAFPIPEEIRGFPEYLRKAGYYTTNNSKTDYNCAAEKAFIARTWDANGAKAHWRNRPAGSPFFSVFNLITTHQSWTSVNSFEQFEQEVGGALPAHTRHDPAAAVLPAYYPDIPSVRRTLARYYDCISAMDQQFGQLLRELKDDGLAEETIVFFYGDNGRGLPRGKRLLHDTGLRVPLIVHVPRKYGQLAPGSPGSVTDRLVSFVDFAPTILSLLGLPIPEQMQGKAFLGASAAEPRRFVFGARDRVDEAIDLSRGVRDKRYLYIRNFMPHLSWMAPERYSDASVMRQEMKRLRDEGKLGAGPMTYASGTKAVEELYDSASDPDQVHNLASSPEQAERLDAFRGELARWIRETRDVGFLPECDAWDRMGAGGTVYQWARADLAGSNPLLTRIWSAANTVGRVGDGAGIAAALGDSDPAVRYWGVIALECAGRDDLKNERALLERLMDDSSPAVRIEAAKAIAEAADNSQRALDLLGRELKSDRPEIILQAMRTIELLGPAARSLEPAVGEALRRAQAPGTRMGDPCWQFIGFSAEATLAHPK